MALTISSATRTRLLALPGITGVAAGFRERDGQLTREEVAVVLVARKRPLQDIPVGERVPGRVEGAPTDVQEASFSAALLLQGDTISPEDGPQVGTLGMIVPHGAEAYGLTNEHVVWARGRCVGNAVRRYAGARIGHVTHALDPSTGMGDAALVRLELRGPVPSGGLTVSGSRAGGGSSGRLLNADPEYDFGVRGKDLGIRGIRTPELGAECWKVGRSTGYTRGLVAAWKASIIVSFGSRGTFTFREQVIVRPLDNDAITLPGDSGSVWCSGDRAIALCFAGDAVHRGTYSVSTPIETVFRHLLGPAWTAWSMLFRTVSVQGAGTT